MKTVDSSGEVVMAVKKAPKQKKTSKPSSSGRNMVPLYVLIIMILATAVVVMMNRSQDGKKPYEASTTSGDAVKSDSQSGNTKTVTEDNKGTETIKDPKNNEQANDVKDKNADDNGSDGSNGITKKVKVYFLVYNERTGKIKPGAVIRDIKGDNDILQALNALAKGMTSAEEKRGLISAMPDSMTFRSVIIRSNIAEIDCSPAFMENAQGDFLTGRLNQIFLTATQFPGVAGITVKINGKPVKSLGGDGLMIVWPMRKTL